MIDVKFNELTASIDLMSADEMTSCILNLREIIEEGKAEWDKLARIIDVDGNDVDAVYAKARMLAAGIGGNAVAAHEIAEANKAFPAIAELHRNLDAALVYEFERMERNVEFFRQMSIDQFVAFKREPGKTIVLRGDAPVKNKNVGWFERIIGWFWEKS